LTVSRRITVGSSPRGNIGSDPNITGLGGRAVGDQRKSRRRLATGWMTLFVVGADLFVISPLLPRLSDCFEISPAKAGLSVTVFSLCYMVSAPFFGYLADKVGRRRMLIFCLMGFAAANLLTATAMSFAWLLAARWAAGAAAAGISPVIYALIGGHAPTHRRATHLAIAVSGLLVSLSLAAPGAAIVGARLGWRSVFAALSAATLLLAWANRRVWPGEPKSAGPTPDVRLHVPKMVLRLMPTVLWSTALYAMFTYLGAGLAFSGDSVRQIAEVMLFYGGGAIAGALLGGRLSDRFGFRLTSTAGLVGLGSCLLLARATMHASLPFVDGAFLMLSATAQLFFPAQQIGLATDFAARRATVLAWNNSALFLGISLGSLIGGQVVAHSGFDAELAISAILATIGSAINLAVAPCAVRPRMGPRQRLSDA
jgi:predicted MFS family arabinose efflux permease